MKSILKFLPLLVIYFLMIIIFSVEGEAHDEWRYVMYAENLLNGFYTEADNPNLMNGPGYPAFLAVFMGLNLPPIVPKLANGFLVFMAVVFLYKTLCFFVSEKVATPTAFFLGLYWPMYKWMIYRISDFLALFLISALIYYTVKLLRSDKFNMRNTAIPFVLIWLSFIYTYFVQVSFKNTYSDKEIP